MKKEINYKALFMVIPALVVFIIFFVIPILYMFYLSFFDWDMVSVNKNYVALDNYKNLFTGEVFPIVLKNTFVYMIFTTICSIILGTLLALFLNKNTVVTRALQGITFAPYVVALVSIAMIWKWMMDNDYGLLNVILNSIGLPKVNWLNDPKIALFSLGAINVWKSLGYNALIILAGLKNIPKHIYEAAALDKSSRIRTFFKITLPMISPSLFFLTIMNVIASFKVFETISIMTEGGPFNSTNTLVYFIYEYGFKYNKIGLATAAGVILFVILAVMTSLYFLLLSKKVHYR